MELYYEQLDKLLTAIYHSEIYTDYIEHAKALKQDQIATDKINEFTALREKFTDIQQYGYHHPDYKEMSKALRKLKREVDCLSAVAQYKKAEVQLQVLLDQIVEKLAESVSVNIKVDAGSPFFIAKKSKKGCGCKSSGGQAC